MPAWNERGEAPLAAFDGAEPPAPDWFKWAIAQEPERSFVEVAGREDRAPGLGRARQARPDPRAWQQRPRRLVELHRPLSRAGLSRRGDLALRHGRLGLARHLFLRDLLPGAARRAPRRPASTTRRSSRSSSATRSAAPRSSTPRGSYPEWMRGAHPGRHRLRRPAAGGRGLPPAAAAHLAQPRLSDAGRGAGALPLHAAAGLQEPLHRRLHRAPLAEARARCEGGGEGWTWRFDPQLWSKLDRTAMASMAMEESATPAGPYLRRELEDHAADQHGRSGRPAARACAR